MGTLNEQQLGKGTARRLGELAEIEKEGSEGGGSFLRS